jgi:hypothetical protein
MKILGSGSLSSRLRILLDVVLALWVLYGLLNAIMLLLLMVFPTHPARHLFQMTTLYSVPAGVCDPGTFLSCSDPDTQVRTRLLAFVNYRPGSRLFLLGVTLVYFVHWGIYLAIIQQLRRVFASLTSGQPFLRTNVRSLRVIGWLIIAAVLFEHASEWALVSMMRSTLTLAGQTPSVPIEFILEDIRLERLFVGATLLVLAEIFRIGAGLQEEQNLTV